MLQHDCPYCGRMFTSKRKMAEHARMLAFCSKCKIFTDLRHVSTCETPKPRKEASVRCPTCRAFKSKRNLARHMLLKHGIPDFKTSHHPELVSVVSYTFWYLCYCGIGLIFTIGRNAVFFLSSNNSVRMSSKIIIGAV